MYCRLFCEFFSTSLKRAEKENLFLCFKENENCDKTNSRLKSFS